MKKDNLQLSKTRIEQLVSKYKSNRNNYVSKRYNETLLRSDFLDPLFELLGWDIKNDAGKPTNEREVILEEPLKANVSESSKKPDYTFRLFSERKFFVEAKKPIIAIQNNNDTAKQLRRYGFTAKLKISVLSNFEYLLIYDCSVKVEEKDNYKKARIKKYHYTEYVKKFDELKRLLGRESIYLGQFDDEWKGIEEKINRYSVDDLFLSQINEWRRLLGAEIYKHQVAITEQLLNDYVQSYLNRIVFLRICEDRNIEEYQTLLKFANKKDFEALIKKFIQADKKYNSGLFDQVLSKKIIEDISSVFWIIIKHLYYPESPYSFAVFSSDILGNIYEIFLSEKLVIKNGVISVEKKPEHLDKDIITTPIFVIDNILKQTVSAYCWDKSDVEILKTKIADIACGSGAFLLQAFQLLQDILIDFYLKTDRSKLIQTSINTYKLPFNLKKEVLLNCIYGNDKDYNASEVSKFGLLLKLLEGEDNVSIGHENLVLPDLSANIIFGNALLEPKDIKDKKQKYSINPYDFKRTKFNIIVGNPPYMKSEDMKQFTPLEFPIYKRKYRSAYKQFDKYFLFIERGMCLLMDKGLLGFIVPNKFVKVGAGLKLRELLKDKACLHTIVSFGANQIFKNKTTYTCLLILSARKNRTFKYLEVKNISNWKARDKESLVFEDIKTSKLSNDVWILVPPSFKKIYEQINRESIPLEKLVGIENIFNGIQTSANDIYIFIPKKEDSKYFYFTKNKIDWKIEKTLTKPYFQTTKGVDNLNTYRPFKPNSLVIYPYKNTEDGIKFIYQEELKQKYPFAYKYLQHFKNMLCAPKRDVKPIPKTKNEWYRYGRHQSLDKCSLPAKIIVGVLSIGNKYAIDFYGTLISSGGTAGYCMVALPISSRYDIHYVQAILNSKYIEWYSTLLGEVFRGGYIARGTKVLKKLPIRKINFNNRIDKKLHDEITKIQKELILQQARIDKKQNDKRALMKLNREFNSLKNDLNLNLKNLYNLGNKDRLVPVICN